MGKNPETTAKPAETEIIETKEEEPPKPITKKITITEFKGEPEDIDIARGERIEWENNQSSFVHVIMIRKDLGEGYYGEHYGEPLRLVPGDTVEYEFTKKGKYQWYSKTRYPKTSGEIIVE